MIVCLLIVCLNDDCLVYVSAPSGSSAFPPDDSMSIFRFILRLGIDDPVDAVAIHGGGGLIGIIAAPIFMDDGEIHYPIYWVSQKKCDYRLNALVERP